MPHFHHTYRCHSRQAHLQSTQGHPQGRTGQTLEPLLGLLLRPTVPPMCPPIPHIVHPSLSQPTHQIHHLALPNLALPRQLQGCPVHLRPVEAEIHCLWARTAREKDVRNKLLSSEVIAVANVFDGFGPLSPADINLKSEWSCWISIYHKLAITWTFSDLIKSWEKGNASPDVLWLRQLQPSLLGISCWTLFVVCLFLSCVLKVSWASPFGLRTVKLLHKIS